MTNGYKVVKSNGRIVTVRSPLSYWYMLDGFKYPKQYKAERLRYRLRYGSNLFPRI